MPGSEDHATPGDAELVRLAANGDRHAFALIFERYSRLVYRFARAMTGSRETAEDVTQEVFMVLMRDLQRYLPERAAFSTYLYGIARNVSRDRLRRERRFLAFLSGTATDSEDVHPIDPFEGVLASETGTEVRRAVRRLPVKYREVLILCDVHDLSYAEAANVLRLSTAAVRSRLHRARQLLRKQLDRSGGTVAGRARLSSAR